MDQKACLVLVKIPLNVIALNVIRIDMDLPILIKIVQLNGIRKKSKLGLFLLLILFLGF